MKLHFTLGNAPTWLAIFGGVANTATAIAHVCPIPVVSAVAAFLILLASVGSSIVTDMGELKAASPLKLIGEAVGAGMAHEMAKGEMNKTIMPGTLGVTTPLPPGVFAVPGWGTGGDNPPSGASVIAAAPTISPANVSTIITP